jgi:hypothetical protein
MSAARPQPSAATLDPGVLQQVPQAIAAFLARQGLGRRGAGAAPEQEAAILALGLIALAAADSEAVLARFFQLLVPLLAKTPQEIDALSRFATSDDARALMRQLFPASSYEATPVIVGPVVDPGPTPVPLGPGPSTPVDPHAKRPEDVNPPPPRPARWAWLRLWQRALEIARSLVNSARSGAERSGSEQARLVRKRLMDVGPRFSLVLAGADDPGAGAPRQRRTAITLSSWEDAGMRLDVPRTVKATLAHGGLFQPRWRPLRRGTEYLFLAQALGLRDLEQERLQLLFDQLCAAGARVARYFYLSDPRQLRDYSTAGDGTFRPIDLATVAERHPHSRLIFVSSGREFLHPFTRRPLGWTQALAAWPRRNLLTPLPAQSWSRIETALQDELQFSVRPATQQSLLDVSASAGAQPKVAAQPSASADDLQGLVGTSDLRYLTDFSPPASEQSALIARLRAYLGERGFRWLALCACYPELNLSLTRYLRTLISPSPGADADDDLLARLVSLTWFRHGVLPAWLRRRVMADLPQAERNELRQSVARMLAEARVARSARPQGRVVLPIWQQQDGGATSGSEFDAVTVDFLIDGPTADIDPLLRLPPEPAGAPEQARPEPPVTKSEPARPQPDAPPPERPHLRPSPSPAKRLRIFISSAGDVASERQRATLVIQRLASEYSRYFALEPYLWEHEPMLASGHFQDAMESPADFDIFLLIVWSRLGTPLPEKTATREYRGSDGRAPISGTEWEFEQALKAFRENGKPDLLVFRNRSEIRLPAGHPEDLDRASAGMETLDAFWRRHFSERGTFAAAHAEYRTLEEFSRQLEDSLRKLIDRRVEELGVRPAWVGRPFRGFQSYEFEDAPIFFGRDAEVVAATDQLRKNAAAGHPFLLVIGASGCGKSSLVKAGIVPRLMTGFGGTTFPRRVTFRPGTWRSDLIHGLARALTQAGDGGTGIPELPGPGRDPEVLEQILRKRGEFERNLRMAKERSGITEGAMLILVIDQLEEIFTLAAQEDRDRFVELLVDMARSGAIWVIATLRADFWARAQQFPDLRALAEESGLFGLIPPSHAGLAEIVRKGAEVAGLSFERDLDAILVESAARAPGSLPLLSFTLDQLYELARSQGKTTLSLADYHSLGGIEGALVQTADRVLAQVPDQARQALPQVLRALTTISDEHAIIARVVPLSSLPQSTPTHQLVDAFIAARLLVVDRDVDGGESVRLAHDALVNHWQRGKDQIAADRRDLATRSWIARLMARWQERGRSPDLLLRDPDLADAIDLLKRWGGEIDPEMRAFIEASRRSRLPFWRRWTA